MALKKCHPPSTAITLFPASFPSVLGGTTVDLLWSCLRIAMLPQMLHLRLWGLSLGWVLLGLVWLSQPIPRINQLWEGWFTPLILSYSPLTSPVCWPDIHTDFLSKPSPDSCQNQRFLSGPSLLCRMVCLGLAFCSNTTTNNLHYKSLMRESSEVKPYPPTG